MPAPSLRWWKDAARPVVILAALALAAAVLAAAPAGADASAARSAPPPGRYNVGATHSPQLLSELAGSSRAAAMTGSGERASVLAPATAAAGDEQGVNVASFQHPKTTQYPRGAPINWPQVAASGVGFAAVKVTEGNYYANPFALTDLAGAEQAGLAVAAYAFAIPDGDRRAGSANPVIQADYLLSHLGGYAATVPLMVDIEYDPYASSDGTNQCYGLRPSAMVTWITAFTGEVQARTGQQPIIYTPPSWWATCTGRSAAFSADPLWVPDFTSSGSPSSTASWASWSFWQYGSTASVPGINDAGATDVNQANPGVLALLDPGRRSQAAGTPVDLPVQQALPPAGQAATFEATGLPPGLSVTPAGTITGWLGQTGTYRVQATATSSTGAVGTVPFTWTVTAAPGSGPAGEVRFGVAGKCLNLAGNNSANGTPVWPVDLQRQRLAAVGRGRRPDAADPRQVPLGFRVRGGERGPRDAPGLRWLRQPALGGRHRGEAGQRRRREVPRRVTRPGLTARRRGSHPVPAAPGRSGRCHPGTCCRRYRAGARQARAAPPAAARSCCRHAAPAPGRNGSPSQTRRYGPRAGAWA